MSEDKAKMFAQRFPYGRMKLPKIKKLKVEKKAPAKKKAAKKDE